jgi:hypothetical protein
MQVIGLKSGVELEEKRGRECVRFIIQHSDYNAYEEACGSGEKPVLLLGEGTFIQGLHCTLPRWSVSHVLEAGLAPAPFAAAMSATLLMGDDREERSVFPIRLDNRSTVRHTYNGLQVWAERDTFIKEAMRLVNERRMLKTNIFDHSYGQKIRDEWKACIARLTPPPEQFDMAKVRV